MRRSVTITFLRFTMRTILAAAAVAALSTAGAASAATIDFTDNDSYTFSTGGASGSIAGGVTYTLTPTGGDLTRVATGAPGMTFPPLMGENDGIGIGDDEVTSPNEALTLTFSSAVTINSLYFLDLFQNPNAMQFNERVFVAADGGVANAFDAQVAFPDAFGYGAFTGLSLTGTTFVFTAGSENDGVANPDFALAGLDVAPVPLPAGVWLLGAALGGFGVMRRRARKAAAA